MTDQPWNGEGARVGQQRADWYAWCDRHGWDYRDPYNHKFWERRQFRAALAVMPEDHPDRWKFLIGAKYSPRGEDWRMTLAVLLSVTGLLLSVLGSVQYGLPVWLIVVPFVVVAWWLHLRAKHRALSS